MTEFLPCYVMLYLAHALWYNAESTSMTWLYCFWYTRQLSNSNIMQGTIFHYGGYWWPWHQAITTKCHCANVDHLLCYFSLKVTEILFQFTQLISGLRSNMNKAYYYTTIYNCAKCHILNYIWTKPRDTKRLLTCCTFYRTLKQITKETSLDFLIL